tara:strand:- start:543 stop:1388 length:846 start_codon:yes stop_codon:yes gene_type:complete
MKQIKYKFNKLAFLISVKIEFLKVRFFYLVNKNKAINNTIKINREYLSTIDKFLPLDVYVKNDYGVQKRIYDELEAEIPELVTYSDLMVFLINDLFKNNISYLEIGVSVLKNYLQINNGVRDSILVAYDINDVNPSFEDFENIKLNNNTLYYFKGSVLDVKDTSKFLDLYKNKFDFVFSDALHTPEAIRSEYEHIIKNILSDDFIIYYDDLDFDGLEKEFYEIKKDLESHKNKKINYYTFFVYGWIGSKEKLHKNGIITNLDFSAYLNERNIKIYGFEEVK